MLSSAFDFSNLDVLEAWKGGLIVAYVTATAGVVMGVYWERDEFPKSVQEYGWRVLVRSLAVELLCGSMVFAIDARITGIQRMEIAALEKRLAARTLSDDQFADVVEQLAPFKGQHFDIVTYWKNPEALAITNRIYDGLLKAGWLYDKPASGEFILGVDTGVTVWFDKRADEPVGKAARALVYALLSNDIYADVDPQAAEAQPDNVPVSTKLIINVGIKP